MDVWLEIKIDWAEYGEWWGWEDVTLQVVISFETGDDDVSDMDCYQWSRMFPYMDKAAYQKSLEQNLDEEELCFITKPEEADSSKNDLGGYREADFNDKYYIDIPDDIRVQDEEIKFDCEVWHLDSLWEGSWDVKILDEDCEYTIGNVGHDDSDTLKDGAGDVNQLNVEFETLGLERANVIAVYENGTVFNGHYQTQEKMSIFQLYVDDSGSGTPFEEGCNVIVIPTSIFTNTLLNKLIQHERLDETPLNGGEFISIDRDESREMTEASNEVDFVFVKDDVSSTEAMEILAAIQEYYVGQDGNFSGDFSFEDDTVGELPAGRYDESTNTTTVEVVSEKDGHNMVLKMSDTVENYSNQTNVFTNFTAQTYGFVEGWVYVDQGTGRVHLDGTQNLTLWFNSTGGYCTDGTDVVVFKADDMTDEWHHFRIEFECTFEKVYSYFFNLNKSKYILIVFFSIFSLAANF